MTKQADVTAHPSPTNSIDVGCTETPKKSNIFI